VQFDPEMQPCDSAGACVTNFVTDAGVIVNYVCVNGLCKRSDGGVPTTTDGGLDAGCTTRETACGDGRDNDCDNLVDCADPDCNLVACDDRNACTTGETCSMNLCRGGTVTMCTNTTNLCQAGTGTCNMQTGACAFAPVNDGTSCGAVASMRCCTGMCINTTNNAAHCGGCGLACSNGQSCTPVNLSSCVTQEPADTSGRCGCSAGTCPSGSGGSQACTNGVCRPAVSTQCAPGEIVGDGGVTCGGFCRY
jgi:hypothetical protein